MFSGSLVLILPEHPDLPLPMGLGISTAVAVLTYALYAWTASRGAATLVDICPVGLRVERAGGQTDVLDWSNLESISGRGSAILVFKPRGRPGVSISLDSLDAAGRARLEAIATE